MAPTRTKLSFLKLENKYPYYVCGDTEADMTLTAHNAYTLDFQTAVPRRIKEEVVRALMEPDPMTGYIRFNKIYRAPEPTAHTLEEAEKMAEDETTLKALQQSRHNIRDRILLVGSEDFFKQRFRLMSLARIRGVVAGDLPSCNELRGAYVKLTRPRSNINLGDRVIFNVENAILSNKSTYIIKPDSPSKKAVSIAESIKKDASF